MEFEQLFKNICKKRSFLCVGLDTDIQKVPKHLLKFDDPVFEFNKQIINATANYCIAYKPNIAFYEAQGSKGWESLKKTVSYIRNNYDVFVIADAKRGDIGNTSDMYAKAFFEEMDFDAITLSPYMGYDSVKPFLKYKNKWVIILALTSNNSAQDFQFLVEKTSKKYIFELVIEKSLQWGNKNNIMYVIGATQASMLKSIRMLISDHFILVPGIGAQGGNLEEVIQNGINANVGLIINSSRNILYASSGIKFAIDAANEAQKIQSEMETLMKKYNIL